MSTLADRAEEFARHARASRRAPGEQDLGESHLARVAGILRYIGARDEVVAAGYLYSLIGSTSVTAAEIERDFGPAISALVRSVAGARRTYAIGAGRLAFEDADVQTLVLATDLAALRGAHELTPEVREGVLDSIRLRAARLLRAHLYLQYEVRQALACWQQAPTRSSRTAGVAGYGAMKSIAEFDSGPRALTGSDPEVRPLICQGSPLSCRVIVVGVSPEGDVPFWRSRVGFDKRAWDAEYLRINQVYSPVRRGLHRLRSALGPEAQLLEAHIHAYPSAGTRGPAGRDQRMDILKFLLEAVRPEVGIFHGRDAAAAGAEMAQRFGFRLLTGKHLGLWLAEDVDALAKDILDCLGGGAEPATPSSDTGAPPAASLDAKRAGCPHE